MKYAIQTKFPITYGNRNAKNGTILIEVRQVETPAELLGKGNQYLVIDWDKSDMRDAVFSKTVFYTNERINEVDTYIEANYSEILTGLSKSEKELKKIQIALMVDTRTNLLPSGKTIYQRELDDWEFVEIPDVITEPINE